MVRFAIIGTNKISHTFMDAALKADGFALEAVYSRKEETGRAFADQYGVKKVYTSLDELGNDACVDAVYIASPNSCHCSQTIQMLEAGKHVLCEKPVATTREELEQMLSAAKANNRIFLEAMRPIFDPGFAKIRELLPEIGTVRRAVFQYCQYSSRYDAYKQGTIMNAFNPALGNAALMDIGIYCVHPAVLLFGLPEQVVSSSVFLPNHMEGMGTALLGYGDKIAEMRYSKVTDSAQPSEIQGENGYMLIWQIPDTRRIEIHYRNGEVKSWEIQKEQNNMYYEVRTFMDLVAAPTGMKDAEYYQNGLQMEMDVVDRIRDSSGITFD